MAKKTAKKVVRAAEKFVQRAEYVAMCAGDSQLLMCDSCLAEFELIYEPKAQGSGDRNVATKFVCYCPFCGSESVARV
jgi:hypothetical protein